MAQMMRTFRQNLIEHLNKSYPDQTNSYSKDELLEFVNMGIEKARNYDITIKRYVAEFMSLLMEEGSDFDTRIENTWVREILVRKQVAAEMKIIQLRQGLNMRRTGREA
jgi:hypothetical protein